MSDEDSPQEQSLSLGQKVALSELAAMLVVWSAGHTGEVGRPLPRMSHKAKMFNPGKDGAYLEHLIKQAAGAGLGSSPYAHALFAHELDYFSGRPRTLGLESDPGAE